MLSLKKKPIFTLVNKGSVSESIPPSISCVARDRALYRQRNVPRHVVVCTPRIHNSASMQQYISNQIQAEKKQWVYDVLAGQREVENQLLSTADFVLLPDTEIANSDEVLNWLAIFRDVSLKSIRSLDGSHIDLLKSCRDQCMDFITKNTNFNPSQILAYFHYLPSVFQLHVHFCAPYGQYTTLDICKIHTLDNVISNLEIDTDYYKKANITTVIIGRGELCSIYIPDEPTALAPDRPSGPDRSSEPNETAEGQS